MSLYHQTLMLDMILYSFEITDIIQLILLCHLHVALLFKDTSYSSLIAVVITHCVGETLKSVHVKDTQYAKVTIRWIKGKYAVRTDLPTLFI